MPRRIPAEVIAKIREYLAVGKSPADVVELIASLGFVASRATVSKERYAMEMAGLIEPAPGGRVVRNGVKLGRPQNAHDLRPRKQRGKSSTVWMLLAPLAEQGKKPSEIKEALEKAGFAVSRQRIHAMLKEITDGKYKLS